MPRISTHILDTSRGKPGAGIAVELHKGQEVIASARTNPDGRTDQPLLEKDTLDPGEYTLIFHTGGFFGPIVIRFQLTNGAENYHIPLLLSPFGYTTYRGS